MKWDQLFGRMKKFVFLWSDTTAALCENERSFIHNRIIAVLAKQVV